ncbi:L-ascorbate metabolism protein UlaG (beta-lactamase superfamily) [Marmoricola sp. OAE513]|uniref:MBL fold metallo-hydrolase n=1 Tax=Marmoricola sp. OAE513 TaxID=2817894 RepID=UPI001AE2C0EC
MRLKPGRPDITAYADRFDVPAAEGDLSVTFLGVSTLLLDDGESAVLTDGFFSRPPMLEVLLSKMRPDVGRIDACLHRALGGRPVEAVVPVHSHFDHAMDSGVVAHRTGARLIGGSSTANVGRGARLPADRITVAQPGEPIELGAWTLTLVESHHCPPDRYPGEITTPVVPPVRAGAYRCGEAWSILVGHRSGPSALVQGSAGFVEGALTGRSAEVAYLGVGQLGLQSETYIETYWDQTVRTVGARRAVLTHWDDFFRPLPMHPGDKQLRALPYAGDDLDVTMRVLTRLATRDGVALSFPTVWERENPWA